MKRAILYSLAFLVFNEALAEELEDISYSTLTCAGDDTKLSGSIMERLNNTLSDNNQYLATVSINGKNPVSFVIINQSSISDCKMGYSVNFSSDLSTSFYHSIQWKPYVCTGSETWLKRNDVKTTLNCSIAKKIY